MAATASELRRIYSYLLGEDDRPERLPELQHALATVARDQPTTRTEADRQLTIANGGVNPELTFTQLECLRVVLSQKDCTYHPHVFGIQVGQTLDIVSEDPTLHNIHAMPMANQEFNFGQAVPGVKMQHVFSTKEVMVPFKCDVHRWMNAFVGVVDHPFFAVTGTDGAFSLNGLPPGTYTVAASGHAPVATRVELSGEHTDHDILLGAPVVVTGSPA